jgi:hypothetical protein
MLERNQRKLTTHQQAVLIHVLHAFPHERVCVCYSPSESDGQSYAQDFLSVFRAIGWDVTGPEPADAPIGESSGLALIVNEAGLPPCAEALRDALRIYGIELATECAGSGNLRSAGFVLRVGRPF